MDTRDIWHILLDLLFPPRGGCPLCGRPGELGAEPVCPACRQELARLWAGYAPCPCCGKQVPAGEGRGACRECRREGRPFLWARAVGPYQGFLREAIHRLKFGGRRSLAEPLGKLVAETVERDYPGDGFDMVVPVPLYPGKRRERHFNQAEAIASSLGRALGLPVENQVLVRKRETKAQGLLSREERLANLAGAFQGKGQLAGKRVLLVDDVFTTGATAGQCTLALLQAGAKEVAVATVATGRILTRSQGS